MRAATTVKTMTQVGVIGVAMLGCATASHEPRRDRAATLRAPTTAIARDPAIASFPWRASDVLTAAELSAMGLTGATAYDALLRLRPGFLNPRDVRTSITGIRVPPAVLVEGAYWGGPEALRDLVASAVAEVQYLRPMDAIHRFGPDYVAGVILVRLRR